MLFQDVLLNTPFSQAVSTIAEATSSELYVLDSESPQFDDSITSFGAVMISEDPSTLGTVSSYIPKRARYLHSMSACPLCKA